MEKENRSLDQEVLSGRGRQFFLPSVLPSEWDYLDTELKAVLIFLFHKYMFESI